MPSQRTRVFQAQEEPTLAFQLLKRPMMNGLISLIDLLQEKRTEEIQLKGEQNLLQENGKPLPGPYLWAVKHEVSADIINIIPYWMDLPLDYRFDLRSAMRTFKPHEPGLKLLDALVLRHFTYHVSRTSRGEGSSPEEVARLRAENEKNFQVMRENYKRGVHAIVFPEGTTQTDGTVFPVKAGCYNLSQIKRDDGTIDVITTIPVGLTYDHVSGDEVPFFLRKLQRKQAFINIGKPLYYEPLPHQEKETDEAYTKADLHRHTNHLREHLISLNTFTVAQLAGEYVLSKAEGGLNKVSKTELEDALSQRVERLRRLPNVTFDDRLRDEPGRHSRIEQFWDGLERHGYIDSEGTLDLKTTLSRPELAHYKRENPLRYCVNRLKQLETYRDDVKGILDTTREELLKTAVSLQCSKSRAY